MCSSVQSDVFAQQWTADAAVSRETLRTMCEPFFEQMVTSVQEALQQQVLQQSHGQLYGEKAQMMQESSPSYFQYQATPFFRLDEESTEANESTAFASLLSSNSSEGEALDAIDRKSESSEPASDGDRNVMVCRHWKSKGWCRLESNCKFLHPEHKRGISAPCRGALCTLGAAGAESETLASSAVRRKRRGGKNRNARGQHELLGNEVQ
jgi:hypothetical protein